MSKVEIYVLILIIVYVLIVVYIVMMGLLFSGSQEGFLEGYFGEDENILLRKWVALQSYMGDCGAKVLAAL